MAILNFHIPDECCSGLLVEALSDLQNSAHAIGSWICPKCGTEWRADMERLDMGEAVRYWVPQMPCLIFKA